MNQITYEQFQSVDIRVGKIIAVDDFPEAKKPAYKLQIDFGAELGIKRSTAQLTQVHSKAELLGLQVVCVVNFPPKQIGPAISEVLVVGFPDANGNATLITTTHPVPIGGKLY